MQGPLDREIAASGPLPTSRPSDPARTTRWVVISIIAGTAEATARVCTRWAGLGLDSATRCAAVFLARARSQSGYNPMRHAPIVLAAAALLSAIVATNVEAAVIKVTASGVVNHGVDGAGVFGQAGSDLVGEAYSAVFNIDTSKAYMTGGIESFLGAEPRYYSSELHSLGGTPPINASLTIGSGSVLVDGSKLATNLYNADLHDDLNELYQEVASDDADLNLFDGFNLVYPVAPGGQGGDFYDPNLNPTNLAFSSFGANYSLGNF